MDFRFTEEKEMLRSNVRKFAEEKLAPIAAEVDEMDDVSWEVAGLLKKQGLFTLLAPEEYGGVGLKAVPICIVREELSRICLHADLLFAETALCTFPISTFGTEEQKRKYLPPFISGENVGCLALTEPNAGSDVANMQTTAILDGDAYVFNGNKCFASVGPMSPSPGQIPLRGAGGFPPLSWRRGLPDSRVSR